MGLSREESISKYGTEAYTGWNEPEAGYDAKAHPEKLNTYGKSASASYVDPYANLPTAKEIADLIINAVTESLPEVPKYSDNPFTFDEELAREASTAEYSPYYKEMLDDFTQDVSMRRQRGVAEENRLLEDLSVERDAGLAERGMTFSGEKKRELTNYNPNVASPMAFMRDLQSKGRDLKLSTRQLLEDLALTKQRGERDIEREKQAAIEGGVLTRRGEALESYLSNVNTQEQGLTLAQPLGVLGTIIPS